MSSTRLCYTGPKWPVRVIVREVASAAEQVAHAELRKRHTTRRVTQRCQRKNKEVLETNCVSEISSAAQSINRWKIRPPRGQPKNGLAKRLVAGTNCRFWPMPGTADIKILQLRVFVSSAVNTANPQMIAVSKDCDMSEATE